MAFVFGKARKVSSLEPQANSPGPGQYLEIEKEADEGFAPFNSASFKISTFDVPPSNTGPGCYDPKHPKEIQQSKQQRMTSSFCSKVQRFKTEQPYHPHPKSQKIMRVSLAEQTQPHKYSSSSHKAPNKQSYSVVIQKSRQKMLSLQMQNQTRKTDSIGSNRQFVRVLLSNPHNTEIMHSVFIEKSIKKKEKGPGTYNIESSNELCKKRSANVVDWSKNTTNRFKHKKNKNPGPGAYQVGQVLTKTQSCMSSSFAYQGLRSHMDELIYKTRMPFKVKVIEEKGLKDRYPGPGYYNPNRVSSKSFHYGEDSFGSYTFYNDEEIPQNQIPGPGHYSFKEKSNAKQELKKTRQKIFGKTKIKVEKTSNLCDKNKEEVRNQCLMEIERTANKFYSLKQRCSSKVGNFNHAQRFDSKDDQAIPGPGQYKVSVTNDDYNAVHHGFNSTSYDRSSFMRSGPNVSFYDLSRNDIGKVANRIKKNIENLRQIQIERAPFNSKQERFKTAEGKAVKAEEGSPQMVSWNAQTEQYKEARYQLIKKTAEEQVQPSATFKSATKRSWAIPSHYQGPGNYYNPSSLEKKSFNQQYNYKAPLKIRSTYRTKSSMT